MGRGVVAMSAKEGVWGGGGGGGGRERPPPPLLLFPPPVAILFFAVLSSVAVLAVAVPLAEGPPTEERPPEGLGGCVYGGSEYEEGEAVATDQQCLNCTCSRGALICHLRACPPMPLAPGCTAVRTESHSCCPSIVCDDTDETERIPIEETTVRIKTTTSGCYVDGQRHEEGSVVPTNAGRCEYCFCANGKVNCESTPCPPSPVGCTPLFNHGSDCCPSRYDCSSASSLTLPSIEQDVILESVILSPKKEDLKLYEEISAKEDDSGAATEEYSGSGYYQVTQNPQTPPPPSPPPPPRSTTTSSPSGGTNAADGRKNRHMDSTTEDDRLARIPSDADGTSEGGNGGMSATQEDIAETSETVDGGWRASTTDQTATETEEEEEALTSDATTELNIENTKREEEMYETTTDEITMLPVTEESCSPGVEGGEEDTEGMTTTTTEGMETTTATAEEGAVTEEEEEVEGGSDVTQTTATTATPDADEGTTSDPSNETTENSAEETTIALTVSAENATSEGNVSYSVTEETEGVIDVGGNSSASVDMREKEEDLSQKSSHVVDIGAEGIDCEVQVNQSTENEKEEESTTMSSEKPANQSAEAEGEAENVLLKEEKANTTEGVILETTLSPLGNSITTVLNIDRKKDVDYEEYDYNEPTLPPSLPNLRIIPFVAADAVVENDNHKTTENSIFYDGAPPSLFSPPVETEGGFVPRDPPILHEVTYQSPVLSEVLPSVHTDVGLVGIAAIEITTTSKPNVPGNFGLLNNDANVTKNSGVLNPSIHLSDKAPHPHITDIRPPLLDNKLSSISLIPKNFTLHNASMATVTSFENLKAATATSMPLTKIQMNGSNLFPPTNEGSFGPIFSSKNSTIKKPGGITSSSLTTSLPSAGHSSAEVPKIPYPDRVSEIPFGPTPPRPSPSTSPSYSVGPNLPPEKPLSPSPLSMPPSRPQNSPVVGLLKLAGCNIYGRMYRVGRIISELSGPCLECRCTEVGVQCRPLPC